MAWQEGAYTYHGVKTLPRTAAIQHPESSYCWAYCLGALLDVGWGEIAVHAPLDSMVRGLEFTGEANNLLLALNGVAATGKWPKLMLLGGRWYNPAWDADRLDMRFPQVTAVRGHYVVVLALGKASGRSDQVRFWDPLTSLIETVTVSQFATRFGPGDQGSFARSTGSGA